MTFHKRVEITLWCDEEGCYNHYDGERTASYTRAMARRGGWACHSGGDYCPEHNTKDD